jgi:hypothetical protein
MLYCIYNTFSVKSAMLKMHVVQNYDNDILEGLAVANSLRIVNSLFLSWRNWWLQILFLLNLQLK